MAEVASNSIQESGIDRLARGREFIPEPGGHFRLKLPLIGDINIFHGHTNGEPRAMVFGVDSPPEVLAGRDDSGKSEGLLSRMEKLAEHPLVKIAAGVALAAGAVVGAGGVLTACSSSADSPHQPVSGHGVQRGPITLENLMNMGGGQPTNWKINSWERHSNMAEIDGEKVIFITHSSGQPKGIDYVKCQAIEDCLSADTEIHSLQGFDAAGMWGPYAGAGGAFQDQEGKDRYMVDADNTSSAQECEIGPGDSGTLEISGCLDVQPTLNGEISIFVKGGIPYALSSGVNIYLRNLHTNEIQEIPWGLDWKWGCGLGVETDSAVIASQLQFYQGIDHCRIVVGSSWQELANFPIALKSLNKGSGYVSEVRLAENYLIYTRDGDHWFALIPIDPENPESGELGAETTGSDTSQSDIPIVDGPDAVDGPETNGADTNEADAGTSGTDVDPGDVIGEVAGTADAVVETTNSGDSGTQTGQDNGPELPQPTDDGEGAAEVSDNGPTADPGEGADPGQTGQDTESELPTPEGDIDENSDTEGLDNGSAESDAGSTAEPQPEPTPELDEDAGSESEPAPESQPEQTPENAPEQTTESTPESISPPEPQPEQSPEPQPEQAPEPQPEPGHQSEPAPEPANTPEPSQSSDAGSSAETANPEPEKEPQPVPWKTVEVDGGCAAVNEHGKPTDPLNHLAPLASLALSLAALGANTRRRVLQTVEAVRKSLKRAT